MMIVESIDFYSSRDDIFEIFFFFKKTKKEGKNFEKKKEKKSKKPLRYHLFLPREKNTSHATTHAREDEKTNSFPEEKKDLRDAA